MSKITVVNNITLDGVMQAPARPDEDTRNGFDHGGWAGPYQDDTIGRKMGEMMTGANGVLLLGRRTYEDLYGYWPKQKDNPFTSHLNKVKKYVVSDTLPEPLGWENSTLIKGEVPAIISALKKEQNLTILGSGELIRSLMEHQLIDTFVLLIFPIVLGKGIRLFHGDTFSKFQLAECLAATTGVIMATYQLSE